MKLKQILTESWYITVDFPVSVDAFNRIMSKHGATITWKTGKGHKQDRRDAEGVFLEFEGERIELLIGRSGRVQGAVGRTQSLDGMKNEVKLDKLKGFFKQEFGDEWYWQDEEEEDDIWEAFPEIRKKRVKRLPQQHNFMNTDKPSVLRNPKVRHLGSGSFASAYTHEDRPHEIRRISKPTANPDAYHVYIEALKNNPDHDNPYFPQIHEVTKYQGRSEGKKTVLSVKAERLHKLTDLNNKEIQAVLERWYGENYKTVLRDLLNIRDVRISIYLITSTIRDLINNENREKIVDQDLLRATIFIDKKVLRKRKGIQSDIGINNLMFRRSPSGIQIVLTDPVA